MHLRGRRFALLNLNAMVHAMAAGLMAIVAIPSILKIFMFTKQSSTPAQAYRRFKANMLHAQLLYLHSIQPGTE